MPYSYVRERVTGSESELSLFKCIHDLMSLILDGCVWYGGDSLSFVLEIERKRE